MPSETCLITGGSGLIGSRLIKCLRTEGYQVRILTRSKSLASTSGYHFWSVENNLLDEPVLKGVDHIIHLAGTNIGAQRWSSYRKREILDSRVKTLHFLFDKIKTGQSSIKTLISASGVGYYGALTSDHIFTEQDPAADDFLGQTCLHWEQAAEMFQDIQARTVMMRTPMVLSKDGGALPRLMWPVKLGVAAPLGHGRQYMPWIHIDDLVAVYLKALTDSSMVGPFNAAASEQPTNREFMKITARIHHKPFWMPPVPSFIFKIIYGDMASILLEGSRVSNDKLLTSGFKFRYSKLSDALYHIYN